jgi:hypothetical protein
VGTISSPQTVTLTNSGNAPLDVTGISISAGFTQTNTCTASVAPRHNCKIAVRFAPSVEGHVTSLLTVNDNATNTPQTVSLSGTGR